MNTRRMAVAVVVGSAVLEAGCSRLYTRRERPLPPVSPPVPTVPVSAPAPPLPPPDPPPPPAQVVALPRADVVTGGIVPSLPGPGGPATVPPEESRPEITAAAAEVEADGPIRGRLEEMRRRREERRNPEQRPAPPTLPQTLPPPNNTPPAQQPPQPSAPTSDLAAVKALVEAATQRWATVPEFEARLTKREVVAGKSQPQNEVLYRFRKKPMSLYMHVLSGPGEGRELLYVQGRFGDKVHIVTGKGDNRLVGAGFKTELDPDDRQLLAKSRYKVTEAGLGRVIAGLTKAVSLAERDPGVKIRATGAVPRPEYPYPLVGIEGQVRPGDDPQLPRGGTRQVFFDPNPQSVGHSLPVLVVTADADGREVEYYSFDRLKIPTGLTDADWSPDRLKRR